MSKQATGTLADFLLARIAEDEVVARAAIVETESGGRWWAVRDRNRDSDAEALALVKGENPLEEPGHDPTYALAAAHICYSDEPDVLLHVARHDPARVLAECEAKRRIVDFMLDEHGATIDGEWGCCHSGADFRNGGRAPEYEGDEFETLPSDCPGAKAALAGLALLAPPYADHPDYREEWRA
jgi:hypothetical protein